MTTNLFIVMIFSFLAGFAVALIYVVIEQQKTIRRNRRILNMSAKSNYQIIDIERWPAPFDDPRWLTLTGLTKSEFKEYLSGMGVNYYDNVSKDFLNGDYGRKGL